MKDDTVSRAAAIDEAEEWIEVVYCEDGDQRERDAIGHVIHGIKELPSVQTCEDAVSRQAAINAMGAINDSICEQQAIDALCELPAVQTCEDDPRADVYYLAEKIGINRLYALVVALRGEPESCDDAVSRQAAIDALDRIGSLDTEADKKYARSVFEALPSVQPERTCVNCGRTVNNGGWYADGRTRCPIEEHYALPKDGYCHLWEKRNVTDDDYPERQEVDGERKTDE